MSTKLSNAESIEHILHEMSLEEKARLVTGGSPFASEPIEKYGIPAMFILDGGTGFNSLQNSAEMGFKIAKHDAEASGKELDRESFGAMGGLLLGMRTIQEYAAQKAADGESIPGKEYGSYPPGMFLGATWNPEAVEACGHALGKEMNSLGVDMILGSPNVNIHRDPLGGRLFEGYSEDPCLVSKLAPSFVKGVQAEGPLADVKHFAANNQETDRMGVEEHIPERALREIYLPGFKACVDAGCKTVMSSYNKINGVPSAMNPWLLKTVLRDEWGFDGFVVSDWAGAYDQVASIAAGNDLAMPGPRGISCIMKAVEEGQLEEEQLDICIRNYLRMLLQAPVMVGSRPSFAMSEAIDATEFAAREGITLLKNDGVLPLAKDIKVAFYGKRSKEFAASGAGSAAVDTSLLTNPFDSTAELLGAENVLFETVANDTNIVFATVGANGQEGSDRHSMDMEVEDQQALEKAVADAKSVGARLVLLLNTAAPVSLANYLDDVSAIVCAYYPGMRGGKVLSDILFGDVNPSGKLPLTYPRHYRDSPTFKNFPGENKEVWYGEGIYVGYRYYDIKNIEPLFPFGHGLSYTTFELTEIQAPEVVDVEKDDVVIRVNIKNTGEHAGAEVVQIYIHDLVSRIDKPEKELKGFKKVFLEVGEEKTAQIVLAKADFASYSMELGAWANEPGEFEILAGVSSKDIRLRKTIMVRCKNSFCLKETSPIGEIAANERAVQAINHIIDSDIIKLASTALVFAPDKTWKEVWAGSVTSSLLGNCTSEQLDEMYQRIIQCFSEI